MDLSERTARIVLAALAAAAIAACAAARVPAFWGDSATYYAMAWYPLEPKSRTATSSTRRATSFACVASTPRGRRASS